MQIRDGKVEEAEEFIRNPIYIPSHIILVTGKTENRKNVMTKQSIGIFTKV
jgi:hypothetical protein